MRHITNIDNNSYIPDEVKGRDITGHTCKLKRPSSTMLLPDTEKQK